MAVRASPLNQFFGKLLGQSQGGESLAQQINNEEEASTMRRLEEGDTSGVDGSEQAFGPQARNTAHTLDPSALPIVPLGPQARRSLDTVTLRS